MLFVYLIPFLLVMPALQRRLHPIATAKIIGTINGKKMLTIKAWQIPLR